MSLLLQETNVQVKYWSHANLTKKQVKEVLFIKARQKSRHNLFYWDLMLKLNRSSTGAIFVENYKIRFSRSDYTHIPMYLYRVSFLTILNIYKDYFKGHRACIVWPNAKGSLVYYSLCRSYCVYTPRVLWPRNFLIFIVDELKNFTTNNLFQVGELVIDWDPCIIS